MIEMHPRSGKTLGQAIKEFASFVSLFGMIASVVQPSGRKTIEIPPGNKSWIARFDLPESHLSSELASEIVLLKRYDWRSENTGTIWDGKILVLHCGYSTLTKTIYWWSEDGGRIRP